MYTSTLSPEAPPRNRYQQAAQAYVGRGWCPVPVEPGGKRPLAKDWPALRLTLTEAVDTWGTDAPPNIGLLCGEPSRLVVLDFDNPDAFNAWAEAHPEAAQTRIVARDNAEPGRCHLYFALPEGLAAPASAKGPGWDLLSTGRQVVAPPSRHPSGGTYRVTHNVPPLPWREEYRPGVQSSAVAELPAARMGTIVPTPAYARAALASEAAAVAATAEGGRSDRLNVAALKCGQLVAAGLLTVPEVETALLPAALAAGLSEREAGPTIASGLRKGQTEPRAVAPPFPKREGLRPVLTTPEPPPQALEPWTAPAPLSSGAAAELTPWPWEALPAVLADMGQAVAAAVGVHDSMAGAAVLGCASIALGNRVTLTIKDGGARHTCRANTYWLVAAPVGSGKTPTLRPCLAPLQEWEAERLPEFRQAYCRWRAAEMVAEAKRGTLKREAAKATADTRTIEHELAQLEAEAGPEPAEPRLYAEDATSEALGRRLVGNSERLGVVSSEGRKVLRIAMGRYTAGGGGDYALWLTGHAGDPHRVDRQGRPPYDLRAPCLSALLFVQPDALQAVGADPEARACGFLARFLYICPPDGGAAAYPCITVPEGTAAAYRRAIRGVLDLPAARDTEGTACPLPAAMRPDAFDLWTELYLGWGGELNEAAAAGNAFLAQWLSKCREHGARLALLFAAVETVAGGGCWPAPLYVTLDDVANAARLCEHLKGHARRAAGIIGESQEIADARRVWAWIAANRGTLQARRQAEGCGAVPAAKARDLMQAGVAGCDTAEAAGRVLRALEARGYLQAVLWQRPGAAARPHELWYVHPTAEGAGHGR